MGVEFEPEGMRESWVLAFEPEVKAKFEPEDMIETEVMTFDLEIGAEFEPEGLDDRKVLAFDLELGVEFEPEGIEESWVLAFEPEGMGDCKWLKNGESEKTGEDVRGGVVTCLKYNNNLIIFIENIIIVMFNLLEEKGNWVFSSIKDRHDF